jgi:hypothetical protein
MKTSITYHLYLREDDRTSLCGMSMFYLKRVRREARQFKEAPHYPVHLSAWWKLFSRKCQDCMDHPKYPMALLAMLDTEPTFVDEVTLVV